LLLTNQARRAEFEGGEEKQVDESFENNFSKRLTTKQKAD
jgi:hypothetical protein